MGYVAVFQQQPRPLARWARALGTDGSAASVATAYARVPAPGAVDQEVSDQHPLPSTRYGTVRRVEPRAQVLDHTPHHSQVTPAPSPPSSPGVDENGCASLCAYLRCTALGRWMSKCLCGCCGVQRSCCEGCTPVPSDDSSAEAEADVARPRSVHYPLLHQWPRVLMPAYVWALLNDPSGSEGRYQRPPVIGARAGVAAEHCGRRAGRAGHLWRRRGGDAVHRLPGKL